MLEKKNYEVNKNISLPDSFINGQALGAVSRMRYGLFPMSYNGCEIIAAYNFLKEYIIISSSIISSVFSSLFLAIFP